MQRPNSTRSSWHIGNDTAAMQRHLTLLFHSRKCPHDDDDGNANGPCPVTPQCSAAKRIWRHIADCHDRKCPHCYPSRYVLTHFRECRDSQCVICLPVREEMAGRRTQGMRGIVKNNTMGTTSTSPSTTDDLTPADGDGKAGLTQVTPTNHDNNNNNDTNNNTTNPMPTLTVAICRSPDDNGGRIVPVRTRSFSSFSSLSGCSSAFSSNLSTRSSSYSAPSSARGGGSGRSYRMSRRYGSAKSCPHVTSGGIKCRENMGIAHFIKEEP